MKTLPRIFSLIFIILGSYYSTYSRQSPFTFEATRIAHAVTIDGLLNEKDWETATDLSGFVQLEPYNLRPASFDTRVRVLYDDKGLYVGAHIFDPRPDSLIKDLRKRDEFGLADAFGFKIDPFGDGLNAFGFFVTVRGVQIDSKTNSDDEDDYNWDAVWRSAVEMNDSGWCAEFMIPYAALRFQKSEMPTWNINFFRSIQRYRELSTWYPIDKQQKIQNSQMGSMLLPTTIEPPVRISATPYLSAGLTHFGVQDEWKGSYNLGMDLKLGLSESFTLDMTLIPDFGQVESDQYIYSLSPFEVYYEEKRPFFTEATELFSKGNVFYSRRIGGRPKKFGQIASQYSSDSILRNPESIQLINASKLTGKTSKGLAIGLFNAITAPSKAEILNSNGSVESLVTEPLTNYNMLVFEQALPNNSQVSFFNTHVWRPDWHNSVFVTGGETTLRNKQNKLEWYGMATVSHQSFSREPKSPGVRYLTSAGKISGKFRPNVWLNLVSDLFDPNEMGFMRNNNELNGGLELNYDEYEPRGSVLRWTVRGRLHQNYQYKPHAYVSTYVQADGRLTLQNHLTIGGYFNSLPFGKVDFYEARRKGMPFGRPAEYAFGFWGSPDYRKRLIADYRFNFSLIPDWESHNLNIRLSPRWRVNDQAILVPSISYDSQKNNRGFLRDSSQGDQTRIIFGKRDVNTISGSVAFDYSFSPNTSLVLRMRHYVLQVDYKDFYTLNADGSLSPDDYSADEDFVVNNLNVDLLFRWNFLPGSEMLLIWKQALNAQNKGQDSLRTYFDHFAELGQTPGINNLSFKVLYYIDWNQLKPVGRKS
ncbi:MAG: carbohydrate binding family 9 domain-containing protein [Bacteroidetes bacterium]|nr:carbohydrate binding family 9 domain-containing protein [Bacteroidota bacterium]